MESAGGRSTAPQRLTIRCSPRPAMTLAHDLHYASLIEVSGQGRSVRVGRYVRPELRAALAREIRMALRGA